MIIGILQRATDAKTETEKGQEKEIVALAYNSALAKKVSNGDSTAVDKDDMNAELTNQGATANGDNPIKVTFTDSKRQYTINSNGIIEFAGTSNEENNPTELTISLEMVHQDVAPTTGGNVASVNSENIPIPTGFYAVAGTEKATGFVISSVENDDLENTKGGDQFVWVPVEQNQKISLKVSSPEDITEIKLYDPVGTELTIGTVSGKTFTNENINPTYNGIYKAEVTTAGNAKTETLTVRSLYAQDAYNDYYTDQYYESDTVINIWTNIFGVPEQYIYQIIGSIFNKTITSKIEFKAWAKDYDLGIGFTDSEDYKASVNANGGFYIGRFEAGITSQRTSGNASTAVSTMDVPVSQIGVDTYNYVTRSQAKGIAEKMYSGKSYLMTNAAWDRTLGWILNGNDKNLTLEDILVDSKSWGNYSGSSITGTGNIAKTGAFGNNTKVNNIYDLAGNVFEFTTGCCPSTGNPYILRGGDYRNTSYIFPAAGKSFVGNADDLGSYYGFRVALFL